MTSVIRSLAAQLGLQVDNWNNGLRSAQREAKAFNQEMKPMLTVGKEFGTVLAASGTAIAGSMLAATKVAVDFGDKLNDLRQKTGASVENLSMLGFAAEQSGSSFEGLATGLKFLAKNMEGARDGGKAQLEAFNSLGVSANALTAAHGDVNKVMLLVADRFKEMPDGAEKTALALQVFGKSGADLIPMLNEGSVGLAKLGVDAQKAGFVMSKETAQACDTLNDTLNEMKGAALGASIGIATALLPGLQSAASLAVEATQAFGGFIKENQELTQAVFAGTSIIAAMGTALVALAIVVPKLQAGFLLLQTAAAGVGIAITGVMIPVAAAGAAIGVAAGSLANYVLKLTGAEKVLDFFTNQALKSFGFQWGSVKEAQDSAAFAAKGATDALANLGSKVVQTHADIIQFAGPMITAEQLTANYRQGTAAAAEAQTKLNAELKAAHQEWLQAKEEIDAAATALNHYQAFQTGVIVAQSNMAGAMKIFSDATREQVDESASLDLAIAGALSSTDLLTEAQRASIGVAMDKNAADANAIEYHIELTKRKDADAEATRAHSAAMQQAINDVKRSAGHIFDDMFIKGESVFKSLKNALKGGALSLGRAIFEDVTAALLGPVKAAFDEFFKGIIEGSGLKSLGKTLGDTIAGALGGGTSAGGFVGPVQPGAAGGGAAAGGGGALGNFNAVTGAVSAVSSVIGNFQMARLEGTMNAVEANTRFTYIELRDLMNLQMNPVIWYLERINTALGGGAAGATPARAAVTSTLPQTGVVTSASQIFANAVDKFVEATKGFTGGRPGTAPPNVAISVEVHNTFRIAGGADITTAVVRDRIMPEITNALKTGVRDFREKWTRIIDGGTDGIVSSAT